MHLWVNERLLLNMIWLAADSIAHDDFSRDKRFTEMMFFIHTQVGDSRRHRLVARDFIMIEVLLSPGFQWCLVDHSL